MVSRRKFRARVIILIAVWLILLAASLSLLSFLATIFNSNFKNQSVVSVSWAGYLIAENLADPQGEVIAVSASWTVPKVNASAGNGYSSAWIGIGGQSDSTLIQVGTEHNSFDGQENYSVWYEMLPDFAVTLTNMKVLAGDTMVAAITLVNSDTNEWSIQISDVTNGQAFNKNVVYNSTRSSGEWIMERPTINNQISTLANFGNITFSGCYANINNVTGAVGNFTSSKIQMTNQQGSLLASVSPLDADGTSFTVNYERGS